MMQSLTNFPLRKTSLDEIFVRGNSMGGNSPRWMNKKNPSTAYRNEPEKIIYISVQKEKVVTILHERWTCLLHLA